VMGDMEVLEEDSFTWVSDATGHTRWLNHVGCPSSLMARLKNVHINHSVIGSDHRSLCFALGNAMVSLSALV